MEGKIHCKNAFMTLLFARSKFVMGWLIYEASQMTSTLPAPAMMSARSLEGGQSHLIWWCIVHRRGREGALSLINGKLVRNV
jgi:hypothetical protein